MIRKHPAYGRMLIRMLGGRGEGYIQIPGWASSPSQSFSYPGLYHSKQMPICVQYELARASFQRLKLDVKHTSVFSAFKFQKSIFKFIKGPFGTRPYSFLSQNLRISARACI